MAREHGPGRCPHSDPRRDWPKEDGERRCVRGRIIPRDTVTMVHDLNDLGNLVSENYAIGEVESTSPIPAMINNVWRVGTSSGRYILKTSRLSQEMLSVAHRLMAYLRECSIPHVQPIETLSETTWVEDGSTTYVLFEYIGGTEWDERDLAQVESAGRLLGEYHRHVAAFPIPEGMPNTTPIGQFPSIDSDVRARISDPAIILRLSSEFSKSYGCLDIDQPYVLVAADSQPPHIRFEGSNISGVFDLVDNLGRVPRVFCLAFSLILWSTYCDGRTVQPAFRPEVLHAFMRGYSTIIDLAPQERRALVDVFRYSWLSARKTIMVFDKRKDLTDYAEETLYLYGRLQKQDADLVSAMLL